MEELRKLLSTAFEERTALTNELSLAKYDEKEASRRFTKWDNGFLMKRCFKSAFAARKEAAEIARAKVQELGEQLRLTTIATEISLDPEQSEPYYRMRDAFSALAECKVIWNVLTQQSIDRIALRSWAETLISRKPLSFRLDSCDLIQWEQNVPHLPNLTGGDMYLYPGFILYRASRQAFALIESLNMDLKYESAEFVENEPVPSDSQVVGRTWAKCNKDGTPDRRFHDNYQIPVARYGTLNLFTHDGLDVRYMCSNAAAAERFAKAWQQFRVACGAPSEPICQDINPTNTPDNLLATVRKVRQTVDNLETAVQRFTDANDKFTEIVTANVHPREDGGSRLIITTDDLDAYKTAIADLIAASKDLEAGAELLTGTKVFGRVFPSAAARGKYQRALLVSRFQILFIFPDFSDNLAGTGDPLKWARVAIIDANVFADRFD